MIFVSNRLQDKTILISKLIEMRLFVTVSMFQDVHEAIETASGGKQASAVYEGERRFP